MAKASKQFNAQPFVVAKGDEFADEHADISNWTETTFSKLGKHTWFEQVDLKSSKEGQKIQEASPEKQRRYVLATMKQLAHWSDESDRVRSQGESELERMNAHLLPGWRETWGRCRQVLTVLQALLKRKLPFTEHDVRSLIEPSLKSSMTCWQWPIGGLVRVCEQIEKTCGIRAEDLEPLKSLSEMLKGTQNRDCVKHAAAIDTLLRTCKSAPPVASVVTPSSIRPVVPAPAGDPRVLRQAKQRLGIVAHLPDAPVELSGHDQVPIRADSPLKTEHDLIVRNIAQMVGQPRYNDFGLNELSDGKLLKEMSQSDLAKLFLATCERLEATRHRNGELVEPPETLPTYQFDSAQSNLARRLCELKFDFTRDVLFDFFLAISMVVPGGRHLGDKLAEQLLEAAAKFSNHALLTDGERYVLHLLRCSFVLTPPMGRMSKVLTLVGNLIGDGRSIFLVPGERWADAANDELTLKTPEERDKWLALFTLAVTATSARPSAKWAKQAAGLLKAVGKAKLKQALARWLPEVKEGRSFPLPGLYLGDTRNAADIMNEQNATILRGLLWMAASIADDEMVRLISQVAISAYKKVPGVGPRAVKVGNACIYALSEIGTEAAVGQLALLKVKVKFGTAQKEIEKAFNVAAAKLGLPREEIEELGVPTYGLEDVGKRRESFCDGEFIAEIVVDGRDAKLNWFKADGKALKSPPAKVKTEHKNDLKELQLAVKDIAAMLPAQCERIDSLFLAQKSWSFAVWKERYIDHPLVGTIARRLIWLVRKNQQSEPVPVMWRGEKLVDAKGKPVVDDPSATVELWHPMSRSPEEVVAWRDFLQQHEIRQPFKQAYREIYPLTEAERRTNTYSNRFASHVIRQHQFNALCAARGWKNKLRLMVDDTYPPATKLLPQWNLRAEYWIEGIGDNYGADTNDSGTYLRLSTDQVRFYQLGAAEVYAHAGGGGYTTNSADAGTNNINEPLPLDQVPPLVFSEVMRDVDLFVGVASVGNDPNWQDGGPEGRYREYWQSYSFGDLSETAKTRRVVLERLLPRLTKLKDKWTLSEKFLVIKGSIRTYKIHLGSGNILMEPNDQYLCIVPDRSSRASETKDVFLPFEGDATLSIILSKAFLLAEDSEITDATITRQLK